MQGKDQRIAASISRQTCCNGLFMSQMLSCPLKRWLWSEYLLVLITLDVLRQERTIPAKRHREVDQTLCQLDSGRGRRALHAAQLTAELQRQELVQEKKDSRCEVITAE